MMQGSLNLQVRGMGQSATLAINEKVRALRGDGRSVINLGLGQSPFPVPEPMVESLREHASKKDYLPVQGLPDLRSAVGRYLRRTQGIEAHAERVLVGPGSKELLFLLQLSFYGDLIVPNPCWVSYMPQAQILGRKVITIPAPKETGWKVTPSTLRSVLEEEGDPGRPRLFVLNYPGNPTGVTYDKAELEALAEVFRAYDIIVLSDEIYGGLRFDGDHASIARYYPEGTIILDGISKWAGAGGWRLGVFIFPEQLAWLQKAMAAVASETYTSVSAPISHAAVRAFDGGARMERYLAHARRVLDRIVGTAHTTLSDAGVDVVRPHGAFYLFPDFTPFRRRLSRRGIKSSRAMCEALLEDTGVAMLPGSAFQRPRDEFTARLSIVDFDGARALLQSESVPLDRDLPADFAARCAPSILAGMDRLVAWLQAR